MGRGSGLGREPRELRAIARSERDLVTLRRQQPGEARRDAGPGADDESRAGHGGLLFDGFDDGTRRPDHSCRES